MLEADPGCLHVKHGALSPWGPRGATYIGIGWPTGLWGSRAVDGGLCCGSRDAGTVPGLSYFDFLISETSET